MKGGEMNKQLKLNKDGSIRSRGIEWADYTWNVIGGCLHECKWSMPDGSIARCYAKDVALGVAGSAYPEGFEHHYWHPDRLDEPVKTKQPARIFLDSMSDLMGHWVPDEQIEAVLDVCRAAHWHTFQLLTKNPKRLAQFEFPDNVWVGFSSPPDFMWGKELSFGAKAQKLRVDLEAMRRVKATVKWCSVEPLSWYMAPYFSGCGLDWVVVGAASNGPKKYQPDKVHLKDLLDCLDYQKIPVFFKGNLERSPWREEFPIDQPAQPVVQSP